MIAWCARELLFSLAAMLYGLIISVATNCPCVLQLSRWFAVSQHYIHAGATDTSVLSCNM